MKLLFESNRKFQIWAYRVSYQSLLIRSTKSSDDDSRIDIRFSQVLFHSLHSYFDGISIYEDVSREELSKFLRNELYTEAGDIWLIKSHDKEGIIIAEGGIFMDESNREYFEDDIWGIISGRL